MFIIIIAKYRRKVRRIANSLNISILCGNEYFENKNFMIILVVIYYIIIYYIYILYFIYNYIITIVLVIRILS